MARNMRAKRRAAAAKRATDNRNLAIARLRSLADTETAARIAALGHGIGEDADPATLRAVRRFEADARSMRPLPPNPSSIGSGYDPIDGWGDTRASKIAGTVVNAILPAPARRQSRRAELRVVDGVVRRVGGRKARDTAPVEAGTVVYCSADPIVGRIAAVHAIPE